MRIHIYSMHDLTEGNTMSKNYPESDFSRKARARRTTTTSTNTTVIHHYDDSCIGIGIDVGIGIGVILTLIVGFLVAGFACQRDYSDSANDYGSSYDQGYSDAQYNMYNDWGYDTNDIPSYAPSIQYAIASTSQTVLWGLADPYNDQIISSSTSLAGTAMPFGIPLTACSVYLVTTDNNGQQAISPVPIAQVPPQFLQYISGCNPASVTPWWVTDQFAPQGPSKLPTVGVCGKFDCNDPSHDDPNYNG